MPKINVRCDEWLKHAVATVSEKAGISQSELVRQAVTDIVSDWGDDLPDWVEKEMHHSEMLTKNRPELRTMHFKQRVFDYARNALTNDMDKLARYPPEPEKMEEKYFHMLDEEIEKEMPEEWEDEFREHVNEVMEWYRLMHPETDHGSPTEEVKALAAWHYRRGRKKQARSVVKRAKDDGQIPASVSVHEVIDEAREEAAKESWKHEWDEAIQT
jgi:DNA phosphorothioation-dependent restriction protein DptG